MNAFRLSTLGPPALLDRTSTRVDLALGKPFALLVFLALERGPVSRDDLAGLFWPGTSRERARQSVRQALWLVRRTLGGGAFESDDPVSLAPGVVAVDLLDLRDALAAGDVAAANALWKGPFLDRFALSGTRGWQRWVEERRDEAANAFAAVLHRSALGEREAGRLAPAIALLRRAVQVAPHKAAAHGLLVDALLDARELDAAAAAIAEARRQFGDGADGLDLTRFEQRLAASRTSADRGRTRPELSTEFVGRAQELADLLGLWSVARSGRTATALICGPTGIGKSRLAAEVAAGVDDGTIVHVKASEAERDIEYGLVGTLVQRMLRLRGAAGVSGASDSVLRALAPSLCNGNHHDPARPDATTEVQPTGPVPVVALADALTDLTGAVSEESRLLVVLDDVQWADRGSRAVLTSLLRRVRTAPCLFVLTIRPADAAPHFSAVLRALEQEQVLTRLDLDPLSAADVAELLGLMAEFPDTASAERIANRLLAVTGGNPLFLIELVRALHDDGVVEFRGGRWIFHAVRLPDDLALPASVRAVVDHRLDRLSPDAAALAGHLARVTHGSLATLRQRANLGEGAFTRAAGELLDRDVVRWADGERLEFTHDQLRDGAARRFPVAPPSFPAAFRWRRSVWRYAAIAAAAIVVGVPATLFAVHAAGNAPPYGGGTLYAAIGDSLVAVDVVGADGPWTVRAPAAPAPAGIASTRLTGPFMEPDGDLFWLGHEDAPPDPPRVVRYDASGRARVVARDSGDATAGAPSPDGRSFLWLRDDPATAAYDYQLMISHADGSGARSLTASGAHIGTGVWARDGSAIAATTYGRAPSEIVILTPRGRVVTRIPMVGQVPNAVAWCRSDLIVARVIKDGAPLLALVDPGTGGVEYPAFPVPEGNLICSPDGRGLAYRSIVDSRLVDIVLDLGDGAHRIVPLPDDARLLVWLPPSPPVVPEGVRITGAPSTLDWGEVEQLRATILMSDGHPGAVRLRWETSDSLTATIDAAGHLTANHPGRVFVTATTDSWLTDTVEIEVLRGDVVDDLVFDDFGPELVALDTTRWIVVGDSPAPFRTAVDGAPALELTGDGQYVDGLYQREARRYPRGLTAEVEFRMPLKRRDLESFNLCIKDVELREGRTGRAATDWVERRRVCFGYPATEMGASDSTRASLSMTGGFVRTVSVLPDLPGDRWTQVAIQVQASGAVDLLLNRRLLLHAPVSIPAFGTRPWRIAISGAAVDTHLYMRNLAVWEGPRY